MPLRRGSLSDTARKDLASGDLELPKAQEGLADLPKDLVKRIVNRVEQIKHTPYHFAEHLTDVKAWKLRVGDYRVIMDIDEKEKSILILKVGHSKNVYKN